MPREAPAGASWRRFRSIAFVERSRKRHSESVVKRRTSRAALTGSLDAITLFEDQRQIETENAATNCDLITAREYLAADALFT